MLSFVLGSPAAADVIDLGVLPESVATPYSGGSPLIACGFLPQPDCTPQIVPTGVFDQIQFEVPPGTISDPFIRFTYADDPGTTGGNATLRRLTSQLPIAPIAHGYSAWYPARPSVDYEFEIEVERPAVEVLGGSTEEPGASYSGTVIVDAPPSDLSLGAVVVLGAVSATPVAVAGGTTSQLTPCLIPAHCSPPPPVYVDRYSFLVSAPGTDVLLRVQPLPDDTENFDVVLADSAGGEVFADPGTASDEFLYLALAAGEYEMRIRTANPVNGWTSIGAVIYNATLEIPTTCPPGQIVSGASCVDCNPGEFSLGGIATTCTPCADGSIAPGPGSASCTSCSIGQTSDPSHVLCEACLAGTANAVPGGTCDPCDAGSFTSSGGQTTCTPCLAGESSSQGATSCTACAPGTANAVPGGICESCTDGFIAPTGGSETCQPCSPGEGSDATHVICEPCLVGEANPDVGGTCTACLAGTFASSVGSYSCTECSPGFSSDEMSNSCEPCLEGTANDVSGGLCALCEPGSFSDTMGSFQCTPCSAGTFTNSYGANMCSACAPGTTSADGATECLAVVVPSSSTPARILLVLLLASLVVLIHGQRRISM